ncbi:MAG: YcaO-like family protein [Pseudomonadota bacterium]
METLADAYKLTGEDHDKTVSPESTIERFQSRCRAAGLTILETTRRIDNNRLGIPVYFSICGHDAHCLTGTKKQMGKGTTPTLAEASAIMELVERFSIYGYLNTPSNFRVDTYNNIGAEAIPFELLAASVHENPETDLDLSRRLFSGLELKWTRAINMSRDREMIVPMDWFFMINEFNGSSSGNCNEEAICQGACEIVERHVSSIISRERKTLPCIDSESVVNPSTRELISKFSRAGIRLFINDFSLDTGIPTIGVLAWDPSTFPHTSELVWTAGCAPSSDKALSRALTEVAQLGGDFNTASSYVASGLPKYQTLIQVAFITDPITTGACRKIGLKDLPDISSPNIRLEIMGIIRQLSKKGFELLTINTTDSRLAIPAFYTMAPGTEFRERADNCSIVMFAAKHTFENNRPEIALKKLTAMTELTPGHYVLHFYQGRCFLALERHADALDQFKKALGCCSSAQDIPSICSFAGSCLKDMGRYSQALTFLQKGIDIDPERADIHNLMGYCHFMLGQHSQSIVCFESVIGLTPSSGIDHASIGSNYREMGQTAKAIRYYEIALMLDPSLTFARDNIERLRGDTVSG